MADAPVTGGSALSPLPLGGRRRSHKKLRVVKKKTVRKMLKKMGLKLRGGAQHAASPLELKGDDVVTDSEAKGAVVAPAMGGRRRRRTGKKSRRSRKVFGLF